MKTGGDAFDGCPEGRPDTMAPMSLGSADLAGVLNFAEQTLVVRDFSEVASVLLPGLADLVGCDTAKLTSLDLRAHREIAVFLPGTQPSTSVLNEYAAPGRACPLREPMAHQLSRPPGERRPVRVSDVLPMGRWKASWLYAATGVGDLMSLVVGGHGPIVQGVCMGRNGGRSFTDRQRDLLLACRGHLAAAVDRVHRDPQHPALQIAPEVKWVTAKNIPGEKDTSPAPGLTPRERDILTLVADGRTDAQIARTLGLSTTTVSKRLHLLYSRLQLPNRAAAARYWNNPPTATQGQ